MCTGIYTKNEGEKGRERDAGQVLSLCLQDLALQGPEGSARPTTKGRALYPGRLRPHTDHTGTLVLPTHPETVAFILCVTSVSSLLPCHTLPQTFEDLINCSLFHISYP